MPNLTKTLSVAANSVSANFLADELHRIVPPGRPIRVQAKSAATGIKLTVLQKAPVVQDQDINYGANPWPSMETDVITSYVSQGGELFITARNTTGAAIVTVVKVDWQ